MPKRLLYHIAFWTGYVFFKSYLNLEASPFTFNTLVTVVSAQLVLLLIKIPMVYALFHFLDRYLSREWSIGKMMLSTIALFAFSVAAFLPVKQYIVIEGIYGTPITLQESLNFSSILSTVFLLGFTCAIATALKLVRANIRQREMAQEITRTKLQTELQFLKAQMNPHFLFNTLNNIYALARKKSDETAGVVVKLSKLLRFILYESQKESISISHEIYVLENYIELEKIRYDGKLKLSFTQSIDDDLQSIAPLILLPFVENAFKHGASESRFTSSIDIDVKLEKGQLQFTCENSKAEEVVSQETEKIGLSNIRRQLELLYPEHTLDIKNGNGYFKVLLHVNLNKYTQAKKLPLA